MKTGKLAKIIFCICLIVSLCIPATMPAKAASGPTVTTTLTDGAVQKGSRKTFDVWAKSASGKKIDSSVTLERSACQPHMGRQRKNELHPCIYKRG